MINDTFTGMELDQTNGTERSIKVQPLYAFQSMRFEFMQGVNLFSQKGLVAQRTHKSLRERLERTAHSPLATNISKGKTAELDHGPGKTDGVAVNYVTPMF